MPTSLGSHGTGKTSAAKSRQLRAGTGEEPQSVPCLPGHTGKPRDGCFEIDAASNRRIDEIAFAR